jgi:hypothetical protein
LVVAGKANERAVAHTLIEKLGSLVPRAHLEGYTEYARYNGAFLEPLKKLASDTRASIRRRHREKVQVCVVVAVAHDRKPGIVPVNACDKHVYIGSANARRYPRRCPTPSQAVLN